MAIGGDNATYDVELLSLDYISHPVPDCLTELNRLPVTGPNSEFAGALDNSGKPLSW